MQRAPVKIHPAVDNGGQPGRPGFSGGTAPTALRQCSCAIDVIATILPCKGHVAAETVLAMRRTSGERSALFRETAPATGFVADLRRAETEILCL